MINGKVGNLERHNIHKNASPVRKGCSRTGKDHDDNLDFLRSHLEVKTIDIRLGISY